MESFTAGALAALKKKKLLENQLEALENNIQRLNEQQGMLEEQRAQIVQLQAMRNAAQASKQTMQELDITSVDKILDEINEQADQMSQIQDAMSQPMGNAAALDEDELLNELQARFPFPFVCHRSICPHRLARLAPDPMSSRTAALLHHRVLNDRGIQGRSHALFACFYRRASFMERAQAGC